MKREEKFWIKQQLKKLSYVRWDRYFLFGDYGMVVFGWIDRLQDEYKDFVTLEFNLNKKQVVFFTTSSAERSPDISKTFDFEHDDCERIENEFDIENCIKIRADKITQAKS